jgi:serine/threonine-protein kinase HipA
MNRCSITYEPLGGDAAYSPRGLRLLARNLKSLAPLELTAEQQRREAISRVGKMSIQGLQLKLSAVLRITGGRFEVVNQGGKYIFKPPSLDYPELPENEDVTMRLASLVGIEVPIHGLLQSVDGSLTYFIKRFDREGRKRLPLEDFAQLSGQSRETKYDSSMEKVAGVIDRFSTFPAIERVKLFERTLFSFLVGNEDMHLKNFSLLTRNQKVALAPAYDFLNTTIALKNPREELALPLNGKKSRLTRNDFLTYFARQRLQMNERVLDDVLSRFSKAVPQWQECLDESFLSLDAKKKFSSLLSERRERLKL